MLPRVRQMTIFVGADRLHAMKTETLFAGEASLTVLDYLLRRRSVPVKALAEPGPTRAQVETMLTAAARVPDHGKLAPWYFIVFAGDNRAKAGALLRAAWLAQEPDATPDKLALEAGKFMQAPVVIAVISRVREGKLPQWEQFLSCGAACQNLSLAAHALGFGVNWLTGWPAFSDAFRASLGLDARDNVAGFFYIGTTAEMPSERDRPDLPDIVTWWTPEAALAKGDKYGREGIGLPDSGIKKI